MNMTTKVLLIVITIIVIGGLCATLIYYGDDIFGEQVTTTTSTEVSTVTQNAMPQEEVAYINTMNAFDAQVVVAINNINALLADPKLSDQTWANSMSAASGEIVRLYNAATQITVPNQTIAQFHNYYVNNVTTKYYMSLQFITTAITQGDTNSLQQAANYIAAGTQARTQYFNQLNSYVASYN
jgi:hypothetical protein